MNKYRRLVIIVAVIDVLVMPCSPRSTAARLRRECRTASMATRILALFDGKSINSALLSIQLMFVGANACGLAGAADQGPSSMTFPASATLKASASSWRSTCC